MRIPNIDVSVPIKSDPAGAMVIHQWFSHRSRRLRALMLVGAATLLLLPFLALSTLDGFQAHVALLAAEHPLSAVQLLALVALAVAAFVFGAVHLVRRGLLKRTIQIEDGRVRVVDVCGGRVVCWEEPVERYVGIRHAVFTTSEGPLHQLSLEHAEPWRSLVIASQRFIGPDAILEAAERYQLPILSTNPYFKSAVLRHVVDAAAGLLPGPRRPRDAIESA